MNIRHIRRAVGLVAKSSVSELHFEDAMGMTLIVRNQPRPHSKPAVPAHVFAMAASLPSDGEVAVAMAPAVAVLERPAVSMARVVTSPMVGRFYRGARRDGEPLVRVGDKVEAGQPVGSVEMMRLMYTIRTDHVGTVEEVLAGDGDAVEYGQPLVRIV